jgi:hypothetical protein
MTKKLQKPHKPAITVPKSEQIIGLLKRSNGASIAELSTTTGWQEHSVRGFMSGALKKKLHLEVTSTREGDKDRRYQIKAQS